jgi:hypothetical protein
MHILFKHRAQTDKCEMSWLTLCAPNHGHNFMVDVFEEPPHSKQRSCMPEICARTDETIYLLEVQALTQSYWPRFLLPSPFAKKWVRIFWFKGADNNWLLYMWFDMGSESTRCQHAIGVRYTLCGTSEAWKKNQWRNNRPFETWFYHVLFESAALHRKCRWVWVGWPGSHQNPRGKIWVYCGHFLRRIAPNWPWNR